ncbi:MAG: photosystem reaction center subunit H [Chthoniobacterales bacterium]|nr:MAG: photosystem reaction center subunit H [Chthoniobacterales bacterium]
MLRSIKQQLYGAKLVTRNSDIGHIKDFYFDDQKWVVRYVVVDTGSWLSGRSVLISPHAFGDLSPDGKSLVVNLTRQQIEKSPPIEAHKPVSRQYEEEYYRYYGWPSYWGVGGFPVAPPSPYPSSGTQTGAGSRARNSDDDSHLRSSQAIDGYHIQATDGSIGHVSDLMMDEKSWAIRHLVVETGHWFSGKEIVISPDHIDRISYDDSKVFVSITREAIQQAPEYHVPSPGAAARDTRGFDAD